MSFARQRQEDQDLNTVLGHAPSSARAVYTASKDRVKHINKNI